MATWERLAHTKLSSSGATIDTGTFTAKKNLKVEVYTLSASVDHYPYMRFNGDSNSNYAYRKNAMEIPDGNTNVNLVYADLYVSGRNGFYVMDITNIADQEKLVIMHNVGGNTGAGNAPLRREYVHKWDNKSDQITQITVHQGNGSNTFDADSYITVWGASDNTVTDEKTTLTNVEAGTRYEETDTRKIYRWKAESSVDATYTEDMSDTTGWSFADTGAVNVTSGSLSYSLNRNGSNDCATYDFGSTISDTKFLLRFSHTPTAQSHSSGSNCIGFFGLSDNTSGQGTSQDFIGFNFASNDSDGATTKNNTTLVANSVTGQASNSHTSGTKYYEIKRNSATEVVFTVYNNSDFTGVYRTQTESSLSSSITSLRYFKFANWHSSGSGSCNVTGTMDDLQLWDGVNSTTSSAQWVERGTA